VVHRPAELSAFEFVKVSALRAAQLMRGCQPRVERRYKATLTAQSEVAQGKVARAEEPSADTHTRGDGSDVGSA
jgi:DNA-directed RNA polymerase subunit K/omega